MTTRTFLAFFETGSEARLAADDLVAAGADRGAVPVVQASAEPGLYAGSLANICCPRPTTTPTRRAFAAGARWW